MKASLANKKIKKFKNNPRKITPKSLGDLGLSMRELGDLGPIVWDVNSEEIVSGNMRDDILKINPNDIRWTEVYDEPQPSGTVGWGLIPFEGESFVIRAVSWTNEAVRQVAALRANANVFGHWDLDKLADFDHEVIENSFLDPKDLFGFNFQDDPPIPPESRNKVNPESKLGVTEKPYLILRFLSSEAMEDIKLKIIELINNEGKNVDIETYIPESVTNNDINSMIKEGLHLMNGDDTDFFSGHTI